VDDLKNWQHVYVCGRLHKPVEILKTNEIIAKASDENLMSAVRTSLLMLPEKFSEEELFKAITRLSYIGDTRMAFAENPNKVNNIVSSNIERFHELYKPVLAKFQDVIAMSTNGTAKQDTGLKARVKLMEQLPSNLIREMKKAFPKLPQQNFFESGIQQGIHSKMITDGIAKIVKRSSLQQTVKGLISAGLLKSIHYASRKISKAMKK